jgi:hypothetical protein
MSVFRISYDTDGYEVANEIFESRELAQAIIDEIRAADGGDSEMHVVEYPVYTDAVSYFRAKWQGCDTFAQFCAYRDSNYTVKPSA